jgi:hypothetical protein
MRAIAVSSCLLLLAACGPASVADVPVVTIDWQVTEQESGPEGQPRRSLALAVTAGVRHSSAYIGTFDGTFTDGREMSTPPLEGVLLRGIMWWEGSGEEVIVRRDTRNRLAVLRRTITEGDPRGEFFSVQQIGIPANAEVRVGEWKEQ